VECKVTEGDYRTNTVQHTGSLYTSQNPGKELGPFHMGELQHHSGQRQYNEADDDKDVGNPLITAEAPEIQVAGFFGSFLPFLEPFLNRTGQPHEQVDSEEDENPQQERSHEDVGAMQSGIIFMGGMAHVAGKALIRSHVAFPAGGHQVRFRYLGSRIGGFQDIMGTMTIGATGRFVISQLVSLAMVGFHVGFSSLPVTRAALGGDFVHEFILAHNGNFMSRVTFYAGGIFRPFGIGPVGMITFHVGFINPFVAGTAGLLYIGRVYGGPRIIHFKDKVRCMAVCTDCADCQSLGGKAQSMNAGRVIGKGIGFTEPLHF